ncbi:MAG TPA: homoserine dehydrogenase [Vicinamibacterales bacterium]
MTLDLILVGFGHVARRFVHLLHEQKRTLERDFDFNARVVAIATRRHGVARSARGLDARNVANRVERQLPVGPEEARSTVAFLRSVLQAHSASARKSQLVVVETTTLDIERGQPAIDHVRAGLSGGAHVITANKGPIAFAYSDLARAAQRADRRLLFEGVVMDGIPVFDFARETLPGVRVTGFRGVVNSTTNFILTAMEQGEPFERALEAMQKAGIAEADASLDVDGWDAAAKTAALANVLLDARLTPKLVEREGIAGLTVDRLAAARARGNRVKLVASARRDGRRVRARVAPTELPATDLLAGLEGQQNAVIFDTDLLGEIAVVQRGSGLTQTAYALVSDLVTIARDVNRPRGTRRARR